jgi:hypothetical protein
LKSVALCWDEIRRTLAITNPLRIGKASTVSEQKPNMEHTTSKTCTRRNYLGRGTLKN